MAKTKRKTIPKKVRLEVYDKYNGRCAYCGKKIEYKDMQLDHLIPVQREWFKKYTEEEIECFENYMPSCRRCNHYKRAHSLKMFREMIEEIPKKLYRDNYIYKVGLDYGLLEPHEHKIEFYFEKVEKEKSAQKNNS
jgi:5-methylcytosine-specific restriction endonuclease McrA